MKESAEHLMICLICLVVIWKWRLLWGAFLARSQWDSPLQLMKSDVSWLGDLSVGMFSLELTEAD